MRNVACIIVLFAVFIACSEEAKLSTEANIVDIELISSNLNELQLNNVVIDNERGLIRLIPNMPVSESLDSIKLVVNIVLSIDAELSKPLSNLHFGSFSDEIMCTVIAENGDTKDWLIQLIANQLPNSDFEDWHEVTGMNGKLYKEPGRNEFAVWATTNFATSIYGAYGTTKFPEGTSTQVRLETTSVGSIPLAAATIFSGTFGSDTSINTQINPYSYINEGVAFGLRPDTMKISYRYTPGQQLIKATPNNTSNLGDGFVVGNIEGKDECHIYAILEQRSGDVIAEIGKAEFFTDARNPRLTDIKIPFTYTDASLPTHIRFFATSSKNGNNYQGAIGSFLVIDDLQFIYE